MHPALQGEKYGGGHVIFSPWLEKNLTAVEGVIPDYLYQLLRGSVMRTQKIKIEPTIIPTVKPDPITELVDEFAELHQRVKAFEATQTRYDELKRQLSAHADTLGDGEVRLSGRVGFVVFGKPINQRSINNIPKFLELVGLQNFFECITVSTTKADRILDAAQKSELFDVSKGSRRLKDCAKLIDVLGAGLRAVTH